MVIRNWALKVFMRNDFLLLSSKIDSHLVVNDISPCHQRVRFFNGLRGQPFYSCSDTLSHTRSSYHCFVVGICYSVVLARVRRCCLMSRTDPLALHGCRSCKQNIRQEIPHHHGKTTERYAWLYGEKTCVGF